MDWGSPSSPSIKHPPGNHRLVIGGKTSIWNHRMDVFQYFHGGWDWSIDPRCAQPQHQGLHLQRQHLRHLLKVQTFSMFVWNRWGFLGCFQLFATGAPSATRVRATTQRVAGFHVGGEMGHRCDRCLNRRISSKPCDPDHVGSWKVSNASCRGKC